MLNVLLRASVLAAIALPVAAAEVPVRVAKVTKSAGSVIAERVE